MSALKHPKKIVHHVRESSRVFRAEFKKQTLTALMAAFGLVIALSWQDVIKKVVGTIPKTGILLYHPYLTDVYSALVVTACAVIGILILSRWSNQTPNA